MTDDNDNDNPTRREIIEEHKDTLLGAILNPYVGDGQKPHSEQQAGTIGTPDVSPDVYLGDEVVDWLEQVLADGGEIYAETVFFETDDSTYTIRAEDDTVIIEKQSND